MSTSDFPYFGVKSWVAAYKGCSPVAGSGSDEHNQACTSRFIGEIENVETIAVGGRIRDVMRLRKQFGEGRWRKLKGVASVRLASGAVRRVELHWYEAHGIGRKKVKIKRFFN